MNPPPPMLPERDWDKTYNKVKALWPRSELSLGEQNLMKATLVGFDQVMLRYAIDRVKLQYTSDTPKIPWFTKAYEQVKREHAPDLAEKTSATREQRIAETRENRAAFDQMRDDLWGLSSRGDLDEYIAAVLDGPSGALHNKLDRNLTFNIGVWSRGFVAAVHKEAFGVES